MRFLWKVWILCLLGVASLGWGAEPAEDDFAIAVEEEADDAAPQQPRFTFSAELLFSDSLLTPIESELRPQCSDHLRLTQTLLSRVKDIEAGRADINALDRSGLSPLMLAARLKNRLVVCYLVASGADVWQKDRAGRTAVDYAEDPLSRELLLVCQEEKTALSDADIEDIEELAGYSAKEQRARLWDSVNYPGNVKEVADLLKYGVDAEGSHHGRLIIESVFLQPECLAWLVRQGYDVNARRQDGSSPFCSISGMDNVRLLLALGMQPNMDDAAERTLIWQLLKAAPSRSAAADAEKGVYPRVEVFFDRAREVDLPVDQRHSSLGASGYLFTGRMELWDENGECVVTQSVQTGGWMSLNSPFRRSGNYPRNSRKGAYDPMQYPDTAFPVLTEETSLATVQSTILCGYAIPDPPGSGRTGLMIHSSDRLGSEGCISASKGMKWAIFCCKMEHFHELGLESIPLRVTYLCNVPDPQRRVGQAAPPAVSRRR